MKRKMKIKSGTDDSKVWHDEKAQIEIATEKMRDTLVMQDVLFFSIFHHSNDAMNEVSQFATPLQLQTSQAPKP